jgi:hypothetical protein
MIYIATVVIPTYDGLDSIYSQRNSDSNVDYTETSLFGFFISPKLSIDYDETKNPRLFCPSQRYRTLDGVEFERKYLRILVKNTGFIKATNCEAKMRIISSNDVKELIWDRAATSGVLREISLQKNIRARKGEELIHVVFSDSCFTRITNEEDRVYTSVSTMDSIINRDTLLLEDVLELREFDIEITVLSDEGAFCKSRFRVSPNVNYSQLTMRKLYEESGDRQSKLFKLKHSWI